MQQADDTTKNHMGKAGTAWVALGANLPGPGGAPDVAVRHALGLLPASGVASALYQTPAFPAGSGPDFANAVIRFPWAGSAPELLEHLHDIEAQMGRARGQRWAARTMDLDLIALDGEILPDLTEWTKWRDLAPEAQLRESPDQLILPHPRLADRAFVLVPMAEIDPGWVHPVSRKTVAQMLEALPLADRAAVRPWSDPAQTR